MPISGELFIGRTRVATAATFAATDPVTANAIEPAFSIAGRDQVERACELAGRAFDSYRELDSEQRARFLETIAERILGLGDELIERARAETALPAARLTGERARTVGQLRLFAEEVRNGGVMGLRVDPALPDRQPAPRPDLRQRRIAIGPVAVFGASNFPLAFSVAGGDTAAALAAGCPVVVKGHPAHPGTSELVASAVSGAGTACGLPDGVFSLLNGNSNELGAALVADPRIKAVGFTGSRAGGLALLRIAAERDQPIPVYAEMSSINPVVLLPAALTADADVLARQFITSMTLGVGQLCTNPGLVIALDSPDLERFIAAAGAALQGVAPGVMLTPSIQTAYESGVARLLRDPRVITLGRGAPSQALRCAGGALFAVHAASVLDDEELMDEVFGASSLIVRCRDEAQLVRVLEHLEGQLTATLHVRAHDYELASRLVSILERKAGRLIVNGWPTGVEVAHAMVHGGPFPATSDGRSTSVGTLAIERFQRPICYQDFPEALLPRPLRNESFEKHPHRFDGAYTPGRR